MTEIQRLKTVEQAREEIENIADLIDGMIEKQKFNLPKTLPQPDYVIYTKNNQIIFYIVTTKKDCCMALRSYEKVMRQLNDSEKAEIRLYCRDLAVQQWLKDAVEPSATDEI